MATRRQISQTIPDPSALKALTHPDRLKMLGLLRIEGPATATQLARRLQLNTGATSYHLRRLAHYGFIESAEDLGDKRDRWWRARHETTSYESADQTGDELATSMAMTQAVLSAHAQQMQRAHEEYRKLPPVWKRASTASDFTMALNSEEALALTEKLMALLWETQSAAPAPGSALEPGMRQFTVMVHAFPYPGFGKRQGGNEVP